MPEAMKTNRVKPAGNGEKLREFGAFRLKLNRLSCLTQNGIRNNYYALVAHETRGVVSAKNTFCAKRMRIGNGIKVTPSLNLSHGGARKFIEIASSSAWGILAMKTG